MTNIQFGNQTILATELPHHLARYQILPILQRELIIEKAIADIQLTTSEHIIALEQYYQKHQLTTPTALSHYLKRYCMTQEQLEALATKELRIEKFKIATWGSSLKSVFLQYKPQLDEVLYSLLRVKELEVAQELYFRIKGGEASFADCASEYSEGGEAQTGGLIGPVPLSQPHPEVAEKLNISQPGQLWTPVKLENWYVIVRLEKLVAAQFDDTTQATLLNHLFEQWLASEMQQTPISICTPVESNPNWESEGVRNSPRRALLSSSSSPLLVTQ
jgi:parvulin-like peptidyl-prolyl isomerase